MQKSAGPDSISDARISACGLLLKIKIHFKVRGGGQECPPYMMFSTETGNFPQGEDVTDDLD
jgi:hypothetical protein